MKTKSKKNIKKNRKHSRKNVRKNKRSRKNVGKYSRKNVMRGGMRGGMDVISKKLLNIIKKIKPDYILLNIGGGTQEILGLYLKNNIHFKCTIICSGAAISFFTGDQAPMNVFFDKIYLGWLIRIIFNPRVFLPRYLKSIKLINIVLNNNIKIFKSK